MRPPSTYVDAVSPSGQEGHSQHDFRNANSGIPTVEAGPWERRNRSDRAACALFDRHYSRRPSIGKRSDLIRLRAVA